MLRRTNATTRFRVLRSGHARGPPSPVELVRDRRDAQHRDDQVHDRDDERDRHQDAGKPGAPEVLPAQFGCFLLGQVASGDELEVFELRQFRIAGQTD